MKRLSATYAALIAAALAAALALPATASTDAGSGGVSPDDPRYQEEQEPAGDYDRVRASWYGPGLYGNRTACGRRLTRRTIGVAHKRLPCGTKVALRYRGRELVVPVIDRGPYSRGIAYDLTYATARRLGLRHTTRLAAAPLAR